MKRLMILCGLLAVFILSACTGQQNTEKEFAAKVGIMLSDTGLGDGSFNDGAFDGLVRARDELNILFDYREAPDGNYSDHLTALSEQDYDLIIGLGFSVQEALEEVAVAYPDQQYILIDGVSDVENIISMTFKDHEGSYLVGTVAALASTSGVIGFIGGVDAPVINRFEAGFRAGAEMADPDIEIITDYAGSFGDADLGRSLADKQIEQGADFIYPAAGYTGTGAILEAQAQGIYSAGVDTDQFYTAEQSVVTSMVKNIDTSVFNLIQELTEGELSSEAYVLGLAEEGVGLAEIRLFQPGDKAQALITDTQQKIISGEITVPETIQ
ncbi:BMP family lipoprotein [Jeotgalibacillus haloalkalitolerans]|uniref:BMP family ABC transporter substrate-binding protein n=1 Tax=Jeotgalibacillus haloalkalitolerans TaxID=3104292 RepID=A0ABU5KQ64_9BACL|nr:BMP family ABC transporter substrate-binding protein [Jeotgalibacillus sp. HH7-29]MDZ5713405.1 BMP family ABC transporter substrate-binding protein [Jeotgalibacillus sp. HH7-29]